MAPPLAEQNPQVAPHAANIAAHLPAMAHRQPHTIAVYAPVGRDRRGRTAYTHLTYQQLDEQSRRIARGLLRLGVEPGTRVGLAVKPSLDFFALVFGLFRSGAVPVIVDPGIGMKHFGRCLGEARIAAFVGIPAAQMARMVLGWARRTLRLSVTVGGGLGGVSLGEVERRGESPDERDAPLGSDGVAPTAPEDLAAILFTSGSTGPAKGVCYTHAHFQAQVAALGQAYDIQPGEIDLGTFPLFGLYAPALGMTGVIPDMDFTRPGRVDPEKILQPIRDFGITTLFGSPALLDRVSRYAAPRGVTLPSLRRVISAGAPVGSSVLQRVSELLTGEAEIFTPYGATEALPVASVGSREILAETAEHTAHGAGVCVGRPVGEIAIRVIETRDEPVEAWYESLCLPNGQIGEIAVHGPVVTQQYDHRLDATQAAKIPDPDGGPAWHRMGDLGYFDEQGRLWFCGRKAHRVSLSERTLYTVPIEGVFNAHPEVRRSALVGVGQGDARQAVVCVETEAGVTPQALPRLREELTALRDRHEHTAHVAGFLFHPGFPVDIRHNAKIRRETLAQWAERHWRRAR